MIRREFLAATVAGLTAALIRAEPHQQFPTAPRARLSVSTYPFRAFILSSHHKTGMNLDAFAATIKGKFNVNGIEPWSEHFESIEPEYVSNLKHSFDRSGVHAVNISVDIGANLCSTRIDERNEAYAHYQKWVDAAKLLGSPSIRVHLPAASVKANYIHCAVDGLKRVADYGRQKNIVINLENDDPRTEDPFRIVEVIKRANTPYLRALPDFCNSMILKNSSSYNDEGLAAMFPLAYNISHVKDREESGEKLYRVDLRAIFAIAKRANYRGYFSIEFDSPGDPYENTTKLIEQSISCLS